MVLVLENPQPGEEYTLCKVILDLVHLVELVDIAKVVLGHLEPEGTAPCASLHASRLSRIHVSNPELPRSLK